jgi:hypothetical protein
MTRQELKQHLNQDNTEAMLESLGIEVGRNHRFKDNTSFSIDREGRIKDFGGDGFSGDIVSFMVDILDMDFKESLKWVEECVL